MQRGSELSCAFSSRINEQSHHRGKCATTITDLRSHRAYDVIEGKSFAKVEAGLIAYQGREKVKVVCMI